MLKIGIITGSIRPNRVNGHVAEYLLERASKRLDVSYGIIDIKDYDLPLYQEHVPAIFGAEAATFGAQAWTKAIDGLDGFIFVTPEYNRGMTSAQKNAIDYLYKPWVNKAAGIVSYGSSGGGSAARALRETLSTLQVATVQAQPCFNLFTDFKEMTSFEPSPAHEGSITTLFNQVEAWAHALRVLRLAQTA